MNAAGGGQSSSRGRSGSADFDLNLAPIIDCFTVLIAFLLASATFLSVGIFEATLPAPANGSAQAQNPASRLDITLEPQPNGELKLRWSGASSGTHRIATSGDQADLKTLSSFLEQLKASAPKEVMASVEIKGHDGSTYADLISLMEAVRPHFASIGIGGF